MTNYTFEIYKTDKRTKEGIRRLGTFDLDLDDMETAESIAAEMESKTKNTKWKVFQTYVTRINLQSGNEFQERYDTPRFCSPSSDAYWD
jgi:hypothetical protein